MAILPETEEVAQRGCCLEARQLWLAYDGSNYVLQGVDLALRPGQIAMILGRSGSGKTTLLKVLNGLLTPQQGSVHIQGLPLGINGRGPSHGIAYIPQNLGLVRSLTALDNTLTGALGRTGTLRSLLRSFPKATLEEAHATLGSLGLAHKGKERVYKLSGGERQRVAIARALMQKPSLILADEFVSQLDPVTAEEILEMMQGIARSGIGLLVTTHETDVVARYADRVIVMRQGRIMHDGPGHLLSEVDMLELLR